MLVEVGYKNFWQKWIFIKELLKTQLSKSPRFLTH